MVQQSSAPAFAGRSAAEILQYGIQQHQAGRLDQAEAAYRHVLSIAPDQADGRHLLGLVAYQRQHHAAAIEEIDRAIRLQPAAAPYRNSLALALLALGRLAEAEASCRAALRLNPDFAAAHGNLGIVLRRAGRPAEAEQCYREALRLNGDFVDAHRNLGNLLVELGRLEEAEANYRAALRLQPDRVDFEHSLGGVLNRLGRHAEAEESCRRAIALAPGDPAGYYNLGIVEYDRNRLAEAEASYRTAIRLQPDHKMAHYNLGHILLLTGRLEEGWPHSEWQPVTHEAGLRDFAAPFWDGGPLGRGVLLLHAEQGLGDTLQFCRYAALAARHATVMLEVQAPLRRLLSGLPGVAQVLARGEALPAFDAHCPLAALPRLFGTVLETIPAEIPYLRADPARVAAWRGRLAGLDGLRVGLVWAGGAVASLPEQLALDRRRSVALDRLAPLAEVAGVSFLSLQKGAPAAQAARPPHGMALHDFTDELADFADTAALVEALDLVISVDTAVAHLAGALGKPVWLLNRFDTCWRWLLERDDSPWYPTLRQFRQPAPGDWDGVMAAVKEALLQLAGSGDDCPEGDTPAQSPPFRHQS